MLSNHFLFGLRLFTRSSCLQWSGVGTSPFLKCRAASPLCVVCGRVPHERRGHHLGGVSSSLVNYAHGRHRPANPAPWCIPVELHWEVVRYSRGLECHPHDQPLPRYLGVLGHARESGVVPATRVSLSVSLWRLSCPNSDIWYFGAHEAPRVPGVPICFFDACELEDRGYPLSGG